MCAQILNTYHVLSDKSQTVYTVPTEEIFQQILFFIVDIL